MFRLFDQSYQQMNIIIEEGPNALWLGDFTAALDRALLNSKGITTVLTVASGLDISYKEGGIVHKVYSILNQTYQILDMEQANIARLFPDTNIQIAEGLKKGSVLVHCAAGVSRSASVVIAYLMKTKGMAFQEAMNFVKKRRAVVQPNYGFVRQLRNYEKELKQVRKDSSQMVVTESVPENKPWQLIKPYERKPAELNIVGQQALQQKNPKLPSSYSTRGNSLGKKKFEPQTTYQGPQIVTYTKNNKLLSKNHFAMPEIKQKK